MDITLLIIGVIAYALALGLLLRRQVLIKQGVNFSLEPDLSSVVNPKIDSLAYYLVISSRELVRYSYVFLVLLIDHLLKWLKSLIIKIEKRFAKIVNQVKGKRQLGERGAVSLFLKEIKDHHDKVKGSPSEVV